MIPTKQNVDSNLTGLESQNFTIQITDKSFRVLLDGLYTNKEQSIVRELWTNAYDSHVAADIQDKPFSCKLPSTFDPTFSVRDYGTSMDHQDVMHLYSTVFASTKTATNDQVGCLGLGSKSPFSYTDSFTVFAYDGTVKRTYIAALNNEGIPTITHLSDEACDEPRGLEIMFAVATSDIERWRKAADNVVIGFDPAPTVTGATVTAPTPIFHGDGLRIYTKKNYWDHSGTNGVNTNMIKMGPVAYPLPEELAGPINNTINRNTAIMLDVPVGSVDFTANRESLQLTPQTREYLTTIIDENMQRLVATATNDINSKDKNYLEACKAFSYWADLVKVDPFSHHGNPLAPQVSTQVRYNKDLGGELVIKTWSGRTVERLQTARGFGLYIYQLDDVKFVINRDPKMARRMVRYKQFSEDNRNVYWLDHPTNDQIMRLMRCFGLKREQFILIENLPDVEVTPKSSGNGGGGSSLSTDTLRGAFRMSKSYSTITQIHSTTDEVFDREFYWIHLETTKVNDDFRLPKCRLVADMSDATWRRDAIRVLAMFLDIDLDEHPIILLGKQARKKLGVTEDNLLDNVMHKMIVANLPTYLKMSQSGNGNNPVKKSVYDLLGMQQSADLPGSVHFELVESYGEDEVRKIHPYKSKYPLLFTASPYSHGDDDMDDTVITDYINFINSK